VGRGVVDRFCVAHFGDAAQVHDGHSVGDVANHREVVGDENDGDTQSAADVTQEVNDLRLHRDIQS